MPAYVAKSGPLVLAAARAANTRRLAELNDPAAYAELLERARLNPATPAKLTVEIAGSRVRIKPAWMIGGIVGWYLSWRWSR